jgi:NTE family protein
VDGGIADNLGLRGPLDIVRLQGGILNLHQIGIEHPKRIVVVVVDAGVQPEPGFSQSWTSPSLKATIGSVTGVQLNRYNFETLELMRATLENWSRDLTRVEGRPVTSYLIEVTFQSIEDPTERAKFDNIPTSLQLDEQTVQQLIERGRRLLRESPEFQALSQELAADSR